MTHPNTDQGVTVEMTRPIIGIENRTAQEVFDIMCDRFRHAHRLSSTAALEAEVERLKQRLESAEGLLKALCDYNPDDPWHKYASARTFLQEQEKQNG